VRRGDNVYTVIPIEELIFVVLTTSSISLSPSNVIETARQTQYDTVSPTSLSPRPLHRRDGAVPVTSILSCPLLLPHHRHSTPIFN